MVIWLCHGIVLLVLALAIDAKAQDLEVVASGGYEQVYLDEDPFLAAGGQFTFISGTACWSVWRFSKWMAGRVEVG